MNAFKEGDQVVVITGQGKGVSPLFDLEEGKVYTVSSATRAGVRLQGHDCRYRTARFQLTTSSVVPVTVVHVSDPLAAVVIELQELTIKRLEAERDEYKRQLKYAMHANMRKRDQLRLQADRVTAAEVRAAAARSSFWGGFFL